MWRRSVGYVEHFVQGKSIKEIARTLKLSRNTVRKVLRSEDTSFSYERQVQPRPKVGRWKEELDRLLATNSEASARERLTLIRIFEELRGLGYDGGYDAIRRYARSWAKVNAGEMASAFVPLIFAPGEAYQFDWSHEIVVMDGVTTIVKVAHVRLCHSRMMFVRAYPGVSGILCAGPGFHQVLTKRSPNMMANWVFASAHSRGGIFHC